MQPSSQPKITIIWSQIGPKTWPKFGSARSRNRPKSGQTGLSPGPRLGPSLPGIGVTQVPTDRPNLGALMPDFKPLKRVCWWIRGDCWSLTPIGSLSPTQIQTAGGLSVCIYKEEDKGGQLKRNREQKKWMKAGSFGGFYGHRFGGNQGQIYSSSLRDWLVFEEIIPLYRKCSFPNFYLILISS